MTTTVEPTIVGFFEPGSPEWHAARAQGIGGSEIAAVVGLSPYESRFSLWHRKKALLGLVEESEPMYWGKVHEPGIAARFSELHPELLVAPSPTYAAAGRSWQIANPDRKVYGEGPVELLEIKTARDDEGWGKQGTDQIPVWYRCQCLWYLDVLGASRCHVAVLIAGSEYREYVIDYNADEATLLREAGARFMHDLEHDVRPDIDGHSATYQTVRVLPEGLDDVDVEVDPLLVRRFHDAQDAYWEAEDELTACKASLLDVIGTGRRAVLAGDRVATRTVRDGKTHSLMPARTRRNCR
ncbi:YqaJ viral recombinase family protein [Streptomyces sp. NPDC056529]|uniref:YqaJ viral recombinase family nuclease n=1 Tax=Streptomyces sp. NPDC056529 TaxID=3345855 RepID=UPI0036A77D29